MKKNVLAITLLAFGICLLMGCEAPGAESASGVKKARVDVPVGANGLTIEQEAVGNRLRQDNKPGSVKHLYVISAYSGQVIIYSTVKGKVTSSGKRLTPTTISGTPATESNARGFAIDIGSSRVYTQEVLQDDGTYGSSVEYLYWWDTRGVYHQHYISGGQILHISDQPLSVKGIIINMEISQKVE